MVRVSLKSLPLFLTLLLEYTVAETGDTKMQPTLSLPTRIGVADAATNLLVGILLFDYGVLYTRLAISQKSPQVWSSPLSESVCDTMVLSRGAGRNRMVARYY